MFGVESAVDPRVYVNAININGLTALDISLNSATDNSIGQIIREAGGKQAAELSQTHTIDIESRAIGEDKNIKFVAMEFKTWVYFMRGDKNENYSEMGNALMVVAALIVTITFQAALSPPGGLYQDGKGQGQAVFEDKLGKFLAFDLLSMVFSFEVIILIIYGKLWKARNKAVINASKYLMLFSILWLMSSFTVANQVIFPKLSKNILISCVSVLWLTGILTIVVPVMYHMLKSMCFMRSGFHLPFDKRRLQGRRDIVFPLRRLDDFV